MAFDGFPKGGVNFFRQLAISQDREWFKAHKADYEELWATPMAALFDELQRVVKAQFPETEGTQAKVFRIYRDVRFSKDKTPFKTTVSGVLPLFGGSAKAEGGTGFYCEFGTEMFVAAGRWMMEPPLLARYRAAVADEKSGAPVGQAVEKLRKAGFTLSAHDALKRPPPGFDAAHPRVELLKLKGFGLTFPAVEPGLLQDGPGLVKRLKGDLQKVAPLLHWIEAVARGTKPLPKV